MIIIYILFPFFVFWLTKPTTFIFKLPFMLEVMLMSPLNIPTIRLPHRFDPGCNHQLVQPDRPAVWESFPSW